MNVSLQGQTNFNTSDFKLLIIRYYLPSKRRLLFNAILLKKIKQPARKIVKQLHCLNKLLFIHNVFVF